MDGLVLGRRDPTPANPTLISDNYIEITRGFQSGQRFMHARQNSDQGGIATIFDLFNKGAVAIKEDGARKWRDHGAGA